MLTIIRGLPGSGKSTLAKQIAKSDPKMWRHYEADIYFEDTNNNYNFVPHKVREAHDWCFAITAQALLRGLNVVVSNTFTRNWEMKRYFDLALKLDIPVQVIECKGKFESIHGVPPEKIEDMKERWEEVIFPVKEPV